MKELTREQRAVYNFKVAASILRPITEMDVAMEDYQEFYDAFTGGVSRFIDSELNFRQAARCKAVKVQPDLEKYSKAIGEKSNTQGVEYLNIGLASFNKFKKAQKFSEYDSKFEKVVQEYGDNLRNILVTMEIKGSDAEELNNVFNEVLKALSSKNGGEAVLNVISSKIEELIKVRQTAGRGAETNIAIWKLIAAAVLLCVGAWLIFKCYYSRWRCSKREKAIYDSILAVAMMIYGACE